MAFDQDEILDRLRSTIHSWTEEVTQAHAELAGQISEARTQLETLATVFGGAIPSAEEAQDHVRHTAALEEAVAGAKSEAAELHSRLEALEDERESLRRELQELAGRTDETDRLSQELVEAHAENAALEEALREKSEQLAARGQAASSAPGAELEELRARIHQLEDEADTIHRVRENLRAERDKLRVELIELREQASLDVPDVESLAELQARLTERDQEVLRLEESLRAASAEAPADSSAELQSLRETVAQLESELAAKAAALETALEQSAAAEDAQQQLAALQNEVVRLQSALNETASELERSRSESAAALEAVSALDDARQEIAKLHARESELQAAVSALQSDSSAGDALAEMQRETAALREELSATQTAAAKAVALERRSGELEQALNDRTRQLEDLEARMVDAQKRSDFEAEALRSERESLRSVIGGKDSELAAQAEAMARAIAEAELARELPALREALERATAETDRLTSELEARDTALRETHDTIVQQDTALAEIQSELHALATKRDDAPDELVGQLEDAIGQLEELHGVLGEREHEIATLKNEIESLGTQLQAPAESSEEVAAMHARIASLEEALAQAATTTEQVEAKEAALSALEEQLASVRGEVSERDRQIAELENRIQTASVAHIAQVQGLEQALSESRAQFDEVKAAFEPELPARLAAAEHRASELESQLSESQLERQSARSRVQELETCIADRDHELAEIRGQLALADPSLRRKLDVAEARIDELECALDEARDTAQSAGADFEASQKLGRELEELRDTHAQLKRDSEAREERKNLLEKEVARLKEQLSILDPNLPGKYAKVKDELASVREKSEAVEKEKASLQRKLNEIGPDLPDLYEDTVRHNESLRASLMQRDAEIDLLRQRLEGFDADLDEQQRRIHSAGYDSQNRRRPMGEILVNAGIISQEQLEDALREQAVSKQRRLGSILVEKGFIREEMIGQVLATQLKLPFVKLAEVQLDPQALSLVSGKQCMQHMLIPVKLDADMLTVAMANPYDLMAVEDVEFASRRTIQPVVATLADITSAIVRVYGVDKTRENAGRR